MIHTAKELSDRPGIFTACKRPSHEWSTYTWEAEQHDLLVELCFAWCRDSGGSFAVTAVTVDEVTDAHETRSPNETEAEHVTQLFWDAVANDGLEEKLADHVGVPVYLDDVKRPY